MSKAIYRRLTGLITGGLIGLGFALTAELINVLRLPDIHLFLAPFGLIGNTLLGLVIGGLLGLISAWTNPSVPGPIYAAAAGAVILLSAGFISGETPLFLIPASFVTYMFLMLPFGAMFLPLTALVRVAINQLTDYRDQPIFLPRRWLMTVILLAAAVGGGLLFKLKTDAITMLQQNQAMITQGLQAPNNEALPEPLRGPQMEDFLGHASSNYEMNWQNKGLNLYAIPRPAMSEADMAVVITHFDNGWILVCLYPNTQIEPRCRGFDQLPRPQNPY